MVKCNQSLPVGLELGNLVGKLVSKLVGMSEGSLVGFCVGIAHSYILKLTSFQGMVSFCNKIICIDF